MSINGTQLPNNFYTAGKSYWSEIDPTIDGMLGGFTCVTNVDITASSRFLNNYFTPIDKKNNDQTMNDKRSKNNREQFRGNDDQSRMTRALDCGAGIGRVTKHLLLKYFDTVDLLEQNQKFLDETESYIGADNWKRIGDRLCFGLQEFDPDPNVKYDCIWCQWVTGHLTDDDFVTFLVRCKSVLKHSNGIIVVKDNTTSSDESDFDTKDSSVVRPHWLMNEIFERAKLTIISERKQYKMPKGIYPVRMWALK